MERVKPQHEAPKELTPDQEVHLNTWDVKIDLWIEDMNKALKKQEEYKEYVSRTHDYKNYS